MDLAHKTGDLAHRTGDIPHKTGDLAHLTGDLADEIGDFAHKTGDLAHKIGLGQGRSSVRRKVVLRGSEQLTRVSSLQVRFFGNSSSEMEPPATS